VPRLPATPPDEKKKTLRAAEQDREEVRAERAAFGARLGPIDPRRLVFVDEAGVTTAMVRRHARAPRGRRAHGAAPAGRWRRLTVLGALGADGVAAAMSVEAATDTAVLLAYLDHVLIPELRRTRPDAVVVMDNLSPHRAPAVRRRLEAAGFELIYLPRYSPDLNPIEPMWAKLKEVLRAVAARTAAALEAALAAALARITPDDARGFFRGCGYATPAN
jgi:transposase